MKVAKIHHFGKPFYSFHSGLPTKICLVMRITAFLLLAACLEVHASGYSQGKLTLSEKDASLPKIFQAIEHQSDYHFFYDYAMLQKAGKVTVEAKEASLEDVLKLCFKDQPFSYTVVGKLVVVKEKGVKKMDEGVIVDPPADIEGRVTDENGEPLYGASVKLKDGKVFAITDEKGNFKIKNISNATIMEVSYTGYVTEELKISSLSPLNISLKRSNNKLDEVQIIAYGTTTQRLNTGNVSTVKSSEIEKQPVNNALLALEGRVPGLFVTQSTGFPGTAATIRIQGQNSINNGNDPLYVLDGIPYTSQLLQPVKNILGTSAGAFGGNPLNFINPADIESIDILKDADATAIYGSRAANGAILITTKKGKSGRTKTNLIFQNGWAKVTRFVPLLDTRQYLAMRREAFINDGTSPGANDYDINGTWDTTRYTDWQKVLMGGTAKYTDAEVSVSGGNSTTQFFVGSGYHKETTVFPGNLSDQKGSLHFNINNVSTNQKFRMQLSGNYMADNNQLMGSDLTATAVKLAPDAPALYNSDGTLNWAPLANGNSTWYNPLASLNNNYGNKTNNLISNAFISYQALKGLDIKSSFGYTNLQSNEIYVQPLISSAPERRSITTRSSIFGNNAINSWSIEPQVSYKHVIGNGTVDVLFGTTLLETNGNSQQLQATGYNSDLTMKSIQQAANVSVYSNTVYSYRYNALFGRINYNGQNKYLISLNARRDGSSRFGSENQFHNFGSAGIGWIFSNESFLQKITSFLSFGKLRASYGTTGNDQIGDYKFMNLYNPYNVAVSYQGATGLLPTGLPNPYLQWEETRKMQVGLDLGIINDKILFSLNYYRNRSSNQLTTLALPNITGTTSLQANLPGLVQNTGWEFTLNTKNIDTKNFSWSSNINFTIPKNELVSFPNFDASTLTSSYAIGQPLTLRKLYHNIGVDKASGLYQFVDKTGHINSSLVFPADAVSFVNTGPKWYGGFQNSFLYKGITLDFLIQFVKQNTATNYNIGNFPGRFVTSNLNGSLLANQPIYVLGRWQKPGDITTIQEFSASYPSIVSNPFNYANSSDLTAGDASYIRLKNLSLSWQLPEKWKQNKHFKNSKLFVQGQNLLTFTSYKGTDPETQSLLTMPPLRIITIGIQVGL